MRPRSQRTISRPAVVSGIGFLTGADVTLTFRPAPAGRGIVFLRSDRPESPVPARIENVVPRQRRTALSNGTVTIELVEHVMAALAGLQIDNCLVELNAAEPPGLDGSCLAFAHALCAADPCDLGVPQPVLDVQRDVTVVGAGGQSVSAGPHESADLSIEYSLDYGPGSSIPAQAVCTVLNPQTFLDEIAFARTFVLEEEARALQAQGYGTRLTSRDLLIFGPQGPIDNSLRAPDECARHKILDCLGDLALLGCDVRGSICCRRSGHKLNADLARLIRASHAQKRRAA